MIDDKIEIEKYLQHDKGQKLLFILGARAV